MHMMEPSLSLVIPVHPLQKKSHFKKSLFAVILACFAQSTSAAVECTTSVANQWWGGSQINVSVENVGSTAVDAWEVELTYASGQVVHSWNADRSGANPAVFTPPSWSGDLSVGNSFSFGYIAQHGSSLELPTIARCEGGEGETIEDQDNDGVEDASDQCADTPLGASVNVSGCPSDSDSDGVFDGLDQCAGTPDGADVDSQGCPSDSDADGVFDGIDQCPLTASGASVDPLGCPSDEDGDGVFDGLDQCPGTASGVSVDSSGCIADEDNDGVPDDSDACPGTLPGIAVEPDGCSTDDDGDGVDNDLDACPNTPFGALVDEQGCALFTSLRVEAEDYIAAFDTTSGNSGSVSQCMYNGMDVDVSNTSDGGAGCNIGWIEQGEYLEYNISLPAGTYKLTTRVASAMTQGAYQLLLGDEVVASDSVENTGGWSSYVTHDLGELDVAGGSYVLRLEVTGSYFNINWMDFEFIAPPPPADTDSDGVNDESDLCPSTMTGQAVNADGCALYQLDSDNDGVNDALDACTATPAGETANTEGCSTSQLDSDNDGVNDAADACPATPAGDTVNAEGCSASQLDTDNDGVNDAVDACPATPAGETANAEGCSTSQLDTDNDGVSDAVDACPATPAGETANAEGCSTSQLDTDNDGVNDAVDACPATPAGETANAEGCSASQLDSDNDGVSDDLDACPATPAGETANAEGCSTSQLDTDNDGVNDAVDACPATPAGETANAEGCSGSQLDTDNDGVSDAHDLCADSPVNVGVTEYGCVQGYDEDGDFIANEIDYCPFTPGIAELRGCAPEHLDFDSDGVVDIEDLCPWTIHPEAILPAELQTMMTHPVDPSGCSSYDIFDSGLEMQVLDGKDRCAYSPEEPNRYPTSVNFDGCIDREVADDDRDGVINGLDSCPAEFGKPGLNGCTDDPSQDWDTDGVPNLEDHCPLSPSNDDVGPNGCSREMPDGVDWEDLDQDGVQNSSDLCPQTPYGHLADFKGCTLLQEHDREDYDNDGVNNKWDKCEDDYPFDHGVSVFGCELGAFEVDFDSDGIPNVIDDCPEETGLLVHQGCPTIFTSTTSASHGLIDAGLNDRDLDFVPDLEDQCPYTRMAKDSSKYFEPEFENDDGLRYVGCSNLDMLDDDNDGVRNGSDRCPRTTEYNFIDEQGCSDFERLDSDGDGLINGEDLCPMHFGIWKMNGCAKDIYDADLDGLENELDQCPVSIVINGEPAPAPYENGCWDDDYQDTDGDGYDNMTDACPNTAFASYVSDGSFVQDDPEAQVDTDRGCSYVDLNPLADDDGDTVPEEIDACPGTVAGSPVSRNGCDDPDADWDKDNVLNSVDQCPGTLRGQMIDDEGCDVTPRLVLAGPILIGHEPEDIELDLALSLHALHTSIDPSDFKLVEVGNVSVDDVQVSPDSDAVDGTAFVTVHVPPHLQDRTIRISVRVRLGESGIDSSWTEIIVSPDFEPDSDGDGIADSVDAFPEDETEWADFDNDGIGDNADTNKDNDPFDDEFDLFPLDPNNWADQDGDGIGDNSDPFPFDFDHTDSDGDGMPDQWELMNNLDPTVANAESDMDGDGYTNIYEFKSNSDPGNVASPIPFLMNDTGQKRCSDVSDDSDSSNYYVVDGELMSTNMLSCLESFDEGGDQIPQGQDATYGRDVHFDDDFDGYAGFSFQKLYSTGAPAAVDVVAWSCVRDNVTGLVWEVKEDENTYTWSELQAYANSANTNGYCGYFDWRIPSREELESIVNYSALETNMAVSYLDTRFFSGQMPMGSSWFWTSDESIADSNAAWAVEFDQGRTTLYLKVGQGRVRLVRGSQ